MKKAFGVINIEMCMCECCICTFFAAPNLDKFSME